MNVCNNGGYRRLLYLVTALLLQLHSGGVTAAASLSSDSPVRDGQAVSLATLPFSAPLWPCD